MPGTPPTVDFPAGPRSCLVIATGTYADPALRQLRAPTRDAADLSAVLADPAVGGFTVTSLVDRSAHEIRMCLEGYLADRTLDDLLVVYLSGHGILDQRGRLHFAAADTLKSYLTATGIAASWLLDRLDECRARQQVLILDCCFSGAFAPDSKGEADVDLSRELIGNGRGRAVLTASRRGENSFEGVPLDGTPPVSVFTAGLVEGLRTGAADPDRQGLVSVEQAYDYAYRYVRAHGAAQTPQRWLYGGEGKIWLARNPLGRAVVPAPLPDPLRDALESRYPAVRLGAVETLAEWLVDGDPGRQLTATARLREIAEADIPRVAEAARGVLGADSHPSPPDPPTVRSDQPVVPSDPPASGAAKVRVRRSAGRSVDPAAPGRLRVFLGRQRRSRAPIVAAVVAVLGVLAAFGVPAALSQWSGRPRDKGGGSNSAGPSTDATLSAGATASAATAAITNPSTRTGGTLRLAANETVDSFDPGRSYLPWVWNFQRSFYARTLLTYAAKPGGAQLVPDLARALPTITNNGRTYTFVLKTGVRFEDGSPIRSVDIKYAIERIFDQDVLRGGPTYFVDSLDQGQGYPGAYKDAALDKLGLKSVQTPDDTTIVFNLARPIFDFPHYLAMPTAAPVRAGADTGVRYGERPSSSGPYKFATNTTGSTIALVRNGQWDSATDSVRKALPDRIELTTGTASKDLDAQLLDGSIDLDASQLGIQPFTQFLIAGDATFKHRGYSSPTGYIRYFALSTKVPPFDNIHCRRAVQYAADKLALQAARGGPDLAGIATSMLPPIVAGYDAARDTFRTKSGKPQTDVAREELTACGQPSGFKTVIAVRDRDKDPAAAEALRKALAAVGIQATIERINSGSYYRSLAGAPSNVHAKGYGIISAAWAPDYPTAGNMLGRLVDGRAISQTSNTNLAELNDPNVNALLDQEQATTDPQAEAGIAAQLDQKVMETAALLPYVNDRTLNYRNPRLTNVFVSDAYGMIDFSALGVT